MKKKTKEKIFNMLYVISVFLLTWFILSYFDTIAHNMTDRTYAWWNLFDLYCKTRKG